MKNLFWAQLIALLFISASLHADDSSHKTNKQALAEFKSEIQPLIKKFCYQCHGEGAEEGDLKIDLLNPDLVNGDSGGKWREVLDAIDRGDMPPEEEDQPTIEQRNKLSQWLSSELKRAANLRRSTGGHVTLRRLTNYEYNNTLRDLLGIKMDYTSEFPPDTKGIDGYKNNGFYLGMSELQLEEYYKAANRGLKAAIVQGEPVKPVHIKVTEGAKGVKFDRLGMAPYDKEIGATIVGAHRQNSKKGKGQLKKTVMTLLCKDKLPDIGTFRVRVEASVLTKEKTYTPPRMLVTVGHKTGVGIEPSDVLGEVDVTGKLDAPQMFEFIGRIEEFPLHLGDAAAKKFPGMRVMITDANAKVTSAPKKSKKDKSEPETKSNPAQLVIHSIELETPIDAAWPPQTHARILHPREQNERDAEYLQTVLNNFITRAFRRPATEDEVKWAEKYFDQLRPQYESFEETLQEVLTTVLLSPKFLYLPEYKSDIPEDKRVSLNDYELATRLSYFLWSTTPDEELIELAKQGKLSTDDILKKQVVRMLQDSKSEEFEKHFSSQWLKLDGVDAVAVNPEYFPNFDNSLKEDMKQESIHFFKEIFKKDLSCLTFLDSDFVMVNDRLAQFYGLPKPNSGDVTRVQK